MAERSEEGKCGFWEGVSAEEGVSGAFVMSKTQEAHPYLRVHLDENMYMALLTIARRVPNVCPADLNSEREEFSSICLAGVDSEPSMHQKTILRLCNSAMWRAAGCQQMEMYTDRGGR